MEGIAIIEDMIAAGMPTSCTLVDARLLNGKLRSRKSGAGEVGSKRNGDKATQGGSQIERLKEDDSAGSTR